MPKRLLVASALLVASVGCRSEAPSDSSEGSEQDLVTGCAGNFKLAAFIETPNITSSIGRSGAFAKAVLADADADGRRDIVYVSPGAAQNPYVMGEDMTFDVTTVRNAGGGAFSASHSQFTGHHAETLFTGDFDGDGRLDVAYLRYGSRELWAVLRDSAGGWKARTKVDVPLCGLAHLYVRPNSIVVRDLDGDGKDDILANIRTSERNAATVVLAGSSDGPGNGRCLTNVDPADPRWERGRIFDWLLAKAGRINIGDFDGDGKLDATSNDGDDGATLSDIFGKQEYAGGPVGGARGRVIVGRFNDDARDDAIWLGGRGFTAHLGGSYVEKSGEKTLFSRTALEGVTFNLSEKEFGREVLIDTNQIMLRGEQYLTPGDFNGDGRIDLVLHVDVPTKELQNQLATGSLPTPTICSRTGGPHIQSNTRLPVEDARSFRLIGAANLDDSPGDELVAQYPAVAGKPAGIAVYTLK